MNGISSLVEQGRQPDLIDEVSNLPEGVESLMYVGYLKDGDTTKALIKEVKKIGDVTTIKYPGGRILFGFDWDNRTDENYSFRK